MKPLLGFIVLTGPLFLIILWVPVCIWLAVWVSRKTIKGKNLALKIAAGLVVFLLTFILPFGDEIAGRIYLNHLCATKAGAKVYQAIELPAKYWDEDGKPRFLKENGDILWDQLSGVARKSSENKRLPSFFSITDYRVVIKDKANKTSGEVNIYMFWGGWLIRATTSSNAAVTCDGWRGNEFWDDFYNSLFKPVGLSGKE